MPTLLVTHTSHFVRGPDGHVYAPRSLVARPFWSRYRTVFDTVVGEGQLRVPIGAVSTEVQFLLSVEPVLT